MDERSIMSDGDYIAGLNRDLMRERARAEDAEAERDRYLEALERLATYAGDHAEYRPRLMNAVWVRDVAREALDG